MKRSALFILIISVFSFQLHIPASAAQYEHILLYVDGREITNLPEPPFMYNDRVLVPAREVFESAGAIVTWEESTQQVLIFYNASLLVLTVNSNNAWLDGSDIKMDVPPLIKNNKVMIPLRFPAECFNFEVDWNGRVPAAYLFSPEPPLAEPTPLPAENINEVILPPEVDIIVDDAPNEPAVAPFKAIDISEREIPAVQFGTATITDLLTPHDLNMAAYTAVSSGPISEVQKTLLPDNRLIIDIYNALNRLEGPFDLHGSVPISGLRASQFMDYPSVTRIVFDVTGAAEYSVMLSDDRTRLTVSFEQNGMNESRITSNGVSDSLTITGSRVPLVQVYPGDLPNQFIINVDKPVFSADGVGSYFNGAFINQAEYSETPNGGGRILLYLNEIPSFNVTEGINSVTVNFYKNTMSENVRYDYFTREIRLPKTDGVLFDISNISHTDNYLDGEYILTLPVDGEAAWGNGELSVNDGYINSISFKNDSQGNTRLIIDESRVLAFTVNEDESDYIIKARLPKEIYPFIVVLDPGHGGIAAPGSISHGITEKDLNMSITGKLIELIENDGRIKVYATRLGDTYVDNYYRPEFANGLGDLFVSIHGNAVEKNPAAVSGTEIFWYPHANDAQLGFSSERFAEIMDNRFKSMLQMNHRGIKSDTLIVLHYATIPAILCETGFITNSGDAALLSDEGFQWQVALAIQYGIQDAFNVYRPLR